jgi:hypothetical protein
VRIEVEVRVSSYIYISENPVSCGATSDLVIEYGILDSIMG